MASGFDHAAVKSLPKPRSVPYANNDSYHGFDHAAVKSLPKLLKISNKENPNAFRSRRREIPA